MNVLQKTLKPLGVLLATALFTSCQTVVEMPIPEHVPKLAIRFMLGNEAPDSVTFAYFPQYQAYVNHSQSIFAAEPLDGINNATLVVTDSHSKVVETFKQDPASNVGVQGNGYYQPVSNFVAVPGQQYTFTVSAPGYETVHSTLTLPDVVSGLQGTFTKISENPGAGKAFEVVGNVTINLPDNGAQSNYYLLYGALLDDRGVANARDYFTELEEDEDITVGSNFKDIHFSGIGYAAAKPFDDKTFNGTTLHLTKQVKLLIGDSQKMPKTLRIYLHSITQDTHRFLKSLNAYNENNGNPFAEASRVVGNVTNGYGYFGGYTSMYIDITL